VAQASTALALGDSPAASSARGQAVTLTATVSVVAPGAGSPGGTVAFTDNGSPTSGCGAVPLSGGSASCTTAAFLATGAHTLTASYGGDLTYFPASSGSISQLVVRGTASASVAGNVSQSVTGQTVTFTATVDPDAPSTLTPTGTVTFRDGSAVICANVAL